MVSPHISLTDEIDQKVREYCKNNNLNYSQGIRKLIETGLDTKDTNKKLDLNNSLLENIFSKQIYIRDFLEQFYSDMEIEKLSNPKNNKALQKYKLEKYRDKFND
ncbi:hypothetical protein [uncultured Clostridium sp.]|uniref:hypothetical protein n=1 Tax=uncultured Clostridium sp. TaxID=59620 RepID=UPI000EE5E031|nr:hypothetical protein [uncultured Clostridium sp.]HAB67009.1 hypothetical protein [Bacillota bacterium]